MKSDSFPNIQTDNIQTGLGKIKYTFSLDYRTSQKITVTFFEKQMYIVVEMNILALSVGFLVSSPTHASKIMYAYST